MLSALWVVFLREARDLARDRRALFFLFAPPILFPLLAVAALVLVGWQVSRQAPEGLTVAVEGADNAPALAALLEEDATLRLVPPPPDPAAALGSGELMALLVIPPDTPVRLQAESPVTLTLTTSRVGWMPSLADLAIRGAVTQYGRDILGARLERRGLDAEWMRPLRLAQVDAPTVGIVAPPAEVSDTAPLARSVNGLAAPLLIASWSMGGSLGLIAYMTAGEKERGTMESLLVTVASRVGVVMGKMTLAMLVSLITVALWGVYWLGYLMFVTFAASLGIEQTPALGLQAQGFGVAGLWLLALMLPLMTMVNGLVAAACTFARNYREAGLFTGVLQFGLPVVSFAATFIVPATPGAAVYAVPVVGTLVAVRDLFLQGLAPAMLVLTGVTSILYGALAILLASYVFSREWALMRGL